MLAFVGGLGSEVQGVRDIPREGGRKGGKIGWEKFISHEYFATN